MINSKDQLNEYLITLTSIILNPTQICDLELLLNGAFYPLKGYLTERDYHSVVKNMRLTTGELWPIPITLDIPEDTAKNISLGDTLVLRDRQLNPLALLTVESLWKPDKIEEALNIYKTQDFEYHRGVNYLLNHTHPYYVGGEISKINLPQHFNFLEYRMTPEMVKAYFLTFNWQNIVAFQTRNPMHHAHVALTKMAMKENNAKLLLQPSIGQNFENDIEYIVRARCYREVINYYPKDSILLNLIPLALRLSGPRDALWHAIIRKNYGVTHFIIGRDHAGPGRNREGNLFYPPYAAQELAKQYESEIGIKILAYERIVYHKKKNKYVTFSPHFDENDLENISGTEFRRLLREGKPIPDWFSYPKIINELKRIYPSLKEKGFTILFTGLSGSGKSTLLELLSASLSDLDNRITSHIDGDDFRHILNKKMGFSKKERDENVLRAGVLASEITKHRGIAICALIAPYHAARLKFREMVSSYGIFIEVYLSTPIQICEMRDSKGYYAKARAGLIKNFTGIDDPYEPPSNPELIIDTSKMTPKDAVDQILLYLNQQGLITYDKVL